MSLAVPSDMEYEKCLVDIECLLDPVVVFETSIKESHANNDSS
jgi:hypothetical protein